MTSTWRIATDTPAYVAEDLSGAGAKASGGRWNSVGTAMVYTSSSISLAALETLVHLASGSLPLNRFLVRVDIPDDVMAAAVITSAATLPVGWLAEPAGRDSIQFGEAWAKSLASAVLVVPSVIVQEDTNVLMNPLHPDASRITATKVRQWRYDQRLVMTPVAKKGSRRQ